MNSEQATAVAKLFRRNYKPYALGVFQIPGPKTILEAAEKDRFHIGGSREHGRWVALGGVLERDSRKVDFTAKVRHLPRREGILLIDDFAYTANARVAVADLRRRFGNRPIAIEIHEENKELKRALLEEGAVYLMTNINAFSQLRSLYAFGLKYDWDTPAIEAKTLALVQPAFITKTTQSMILTEIRTYEINWADHYSNYNKGHSWSAFALKGYKADDPGFIIKPREMTAAWKKENPGPYVDESVETEAARHFPTLMYQVKRLPGVKDRVRLMRLTPQGELTRHCDITDKDAGVAEGKVIRLHIPITTNPAVDFHAINARGKQLKIHMHERNLYYLDQRKPHFVENRDPDQERIHLVVDCFSTPELRAMLGRAKDGKSE